MIKLLFRRYVLKLLCSLLFFKCIYVNAFPSGCEVTGFAFFNNYLMLNDSPKQSFYLLQNFSDTQIELKRFAPKKIFMMPSLLIQLEPQKWAALAVDLQNLYFQCFIKKNDKTEAIGCQDVLDVCKYPRAKFALSNMGSYWVSANKEQTEVIKEAAHKGIYLHW